MLASMPATQGMEPDWKKRRMAMASFRHPSLLARADDGGAWAEDPCNDYGNDEAGGVRMQSERRRRVVPAGAAGAATHLELGLLGDPDLDALLATLGATAGDDTEEPEDLVEGPSVRVSCQTATWTSRCSH